MKENKEEGTGTKIDLKGKGGQTQRRTEKDLCTKEGTEGNREDIHRKIAV
jgi:hypothetical protein